MVGLSLQRCGRLLRQAWQEKKASWRWQIEMLAVMEEAMSTRPGAWQAQNTSRYALELESLRAIALTQAVLQG